MPGVKVYTFAQSEEEIGEKTCPHCEAIDSIKRRGLNSTMVKQLLALYKYFENPRHFNNLQVHLDDSMGHWVHASRYLGGHLGLDRECMKLRHWGFVEKHPDRKEDGNPHNGYIRITPRGKKFCLREFKVYGAILTRNQGRGLVGFVSEKLVDIVAAGGKHFNYDQEIRGRPS